MKNISKNETKLLEYLRKYYTKNRYFPSVREMMNYLDIKSTSTIQYYLNKLEEKGKIKRDSNSKARAFKYVENCTNSLLDATPKNYQNIEALSRIPLLGNVAAGHPIFAVENYDSYIDISSDLFRTENIFSLKVKGTSMIDAGINDGDIIFVNQQNTATNGEIVVAMIDRDVTVKRFYKENNCFRLQPENPTMQPIYCNELTILGKVVGLLRKM